LQPLNTFCVANQFIANIMQMSKFGFRAITGNPLASEKS
jgi:hypothetical protein